MHERVLGQVEVRGKFTLSESEMNKKLFVGSLPYTTTSEELKSLFAQAGTVAEAVVISDKFSGRSRGFGFVEMSTDEEAKAAIEKFNGHDMEGRKIVVNEARPPKARFEK